MSDYDFAVIGGGSAGYAAARTAASLGLKTIVLDGGKEVGGLCILRGCMPSKSLIESANRFRAFGQAREFGLRVTDFSYDATEIVARKRRLIGEFADFRREQLETGKFEFVRGKASFLDAQNLQVDLLDGTTRTITTRSALVATGSVVNVPPVPGLAESGAWTSDDVLELTAIPDSIIVLGAGPVALEMAHYLASLGSKVTIIQRSAQLLTGVDPDVAAELGRALKERGLEIHTGTSLVQVEREGDLRRVTFEKGGITHTAEAPALLNALGRRPNLASLGLEKAGIAVEGNHIAASATQQTSVPHIFAAGDCCGPYEVVHIAIEQAELAVRNAVKVLQGSGTLEKMDYRLKLYAVFTEPQVAVVGLSEAEAAAKGLEYLTASYPFNDHGKSMIMDEMHGFVKLIVEKHSREIIGASVVGPHASDLIEEVIVAMRFRSTAGQFALIPHYHPTLCEIWTYPASDLAEDASVES